MGGLHPLLVSGLNQLGHIVAYNGGTMRMTSGYRTRSQQRRLRQRYEAGLSPYYAAPPGHSAHERGHAADLVIQPSWMQYAAGQLWARAGGVWGGASDPVHFGLS